MPACKRPWDNRPVPEGNGKGIPLVCQVHSSTKPEARASVRDPVLTRFQGGVPSRQDGLGGRISHRRGWRRSLEKVPGHKRLVRYCTTFMARWGSFQNPFASRVMKATASAAGQTRPAQAPLWSVHGGTQDTRASGPIRPRAASTGMTPCGRRCPGRAPSKW